MGTLGFNTPGSFNTMTDEQLSLLYKEINLRIQKLKERPEEDKVKSAVMKELLVLEQTLDSFEIPLGHKNMALSIKNYFSDTNSESSQSHLQPEVKSNQSKKFKAEQLTPQPEELEGKIKETSTKLIEKLFPEGLQKDAQDCQMSLHNNKWSVKCLFCDSTFSVYTQPPYNNVVISRYRDHLIKYHHGTKSNPQIESLMVI